MYKLCMCVADSHEKVNVNLQFKPDWFLNRNPLGEVPVLEYNDKVRLIYVCTLSLILQ